LLGECMHLWKPGSSRRLCLETALQARRHQFFDVAPAQRALGWTPERPLDDALRESMAWFRDQTPAVEPSSAASEPHVA
jgi:nucleoside-diphosphate-sugar epimerase